MNRAKLIITGILGLFMLLSVACGAGEAPTAATPTPAPEVPLAPADPTATPAPPTSTSPPPTREAAAATDEPADGDTGGGSSESVAAGQEIFMGICAACHQIDGLSTAQTGPDLTHIGAEAADRKEGMSAEDYIMESIVDPEAFVPQGVERATPGLMTKAITQSLSESQIEELVKFLMAQE